MKEQITIFHLQRKEGSPLLLHPFTDPLRLLQLTEETEIVGRYGREPRPESITLLRNDLYRAVEVAVKSWISEKRFIPRFILSSAIFLLVYLFLSLVVRDPLPMLDEIAIALGSAIAFYFIMAKRDRSSREAGERRIMLREKIDRIYFDHHPFLDDVERMLDLLEDAPDALLMSMEMEESNQERSLPGEAEELVSYLEQRFSSRAYRRLEKRRKRLKKRGPVEEHGNTTADTRAHTDSHTHGDVQKPAGRKQVDLPLFSLYQLLREAPLQK